MLKYLFAATAGVLLSWAANTPAQNIQLDEQSMEDAWSKEQPEFESLSDDPYDSGRGYDYGYPDGRGTRPSTEMDSFGRGGWDRPRENPDDAEENE